MQIRKGDTVIIRTGKDAGKKGTVLSIDKKTDRVLVDGLNMKKRHMKPTKSNTKGQMFDMPHTIARSAVGLIDPKSGKATRIKQKEVNGKKVRVSSKSGQEI